MIDPPETCTLCQINTSPFKITGQTLMGEVMVPYALCEQCYQLAIPNDDPNKLFEAKKKLIRRVMNRLKSRKDP